MLETEQGEAAAGENDHVSLRDLTQSTSRRQRRELPQFIPANRLASKQMFHFFCRHTSAVCLRHNLVPRFSIFYMVRRVACAADVDIDRRVRHITWIPSLLYSRIVHRPSGAACDVGSCWIHGWPGPGDLLGGSSSLPSPAQ